MQPMPHLVPVEPDTFSELFDAVRTYGDVYCRTEASGRWGIGFDAGRCHFHYIERGSAIAKCDGKLTRATSGDLLIFPQGTGHALLSDVRASAVPLVTLVRTHLDPGQRLLRLGGSDTQLVCGTFHFNEFGTISLLRGLPAVLHLSAQDTMAFNWLEMTLRFLSLETQSPSLGSAKMVSSLIDLMFIQSVRHWAKKDTSATGWIAAFTDKAVGRALTLMHDDVAHPWTVDELAARVGSSRASLFARFSKLVGCPPLRYLTEWRMALAKRYLLESEEPIASVASRIGYDEAAFSRAFMREVRMRPSDYRRERIEQGLAA